MKTTNEIYLKISSKCPIPMDLEIDEDVAFIIRGAVVKTETMSNQNGTIDKVCIVKPLTAEKYEDK